jgi:DivIVA domain-containing protein
MRRLTGLDIRLADFRVSRIPGGYRRADVDEYLVMVADEIERYASDLEAREPAAATERSGAGAATGPSPEQLAVTARPNPAHAASVEPIPASGSVPVARAVEAMVAAAQHSADEIVEQARRTAAELDRNAAAARGELSTRAQRDAEAVLHAAQQQAAALLSDARERHQLAERAEAEAELKLAHVEHRLEERALALAAEARRLDELAAWLAEQDLRPDAGEPSRVLGEVEGTETQPRRVIEFRRAD